MKSFVAVLSLALLPVAFAQENQLQIRPLGSQIQLSWQDRSFFWDEDYRAVFPKYSLELSQDLSHWAKAGVEIANREGTSAKEYTVTRNINQTAKSEFFRLLPVTNLKDFESSVEGSFASPYFYVYDIANLTSFSTYVTSATTSLVASRGRLSAVAAPPYFGVYDGINGRYTERYVTSTTAPLAISVSPLMAATQMGPYFGVYDAVAQRYEEHYETSSPDHHRVLAGLNISLSVMEPYFAVVYRRDDGTSVYKYGNVTSLDASDPAPKLVVGDRVAAAIMDSYFAVYDHTRNRVSYAYLSHTDVGTRAVLKVIDGVAHALIAGRDYYYKFEDGIFYYRTLSSVSTPPAAKNAVTATRTSFESEIPAPHPDDLRETALKTLIAPEDKK